MISPESSQPYDALDHELHALLLNDERMRTNLDAPYSLANTKQFLLDSLTRHLDTFVDHNMASKKDNGVTLDVILEAVEIDFLQQNELFYGDEVLAYGDSLAIMDDLSDTTPAGYSALLLSNAAKVRGTFTKLVIIETPQLQHLNELRNSPVGSTHRHTTYNKFGLSFLITDVVFTDEEGVSSQIMPPNIVFVPLTYPGLKLDRFIRPSVA